MKRFRITGEEIFQVDGDSEPFGTKRRVVWKGASLPSDDDIAEVRQNTADEYPKMVTEPFYDANEERYGSEDIKITMPPESIRLEQRRRLLPFVFRSLDTTGLQIERHDTE